MPGTRRVFLSRLPEHDLPKRIAWPVLEKPMVRSDLLRAIEQVIEKGAAWHG
jgi:hypothetical protein